ncbi:hypothetical protein D1007_34512 [Hordeum vulgare]|nr:hypothetical protein D1007_34512 [Hordeum vulgare]
MGFGDHLPPAGPSRRHRPDLHHDPLHHLVVASSMGELWEECVRRATELEQAVTNALFSMAGTAPSSASRCPPIAYTP